MVIRAKRFNIYLLALTVMALFTACRSAESKSKKQVAVLGVHVEVSHDETGLNEPVTVFRSSPMLVNIEKSPFLTEVLVTDAKIVENPGGFAIQIHFDRRGTLLLEQYSAKNPGKRFVIKAEFGEKLAKSRWLAAPLVSRRITDGILTFTPDANREEAEQIVLGLNNLAKSTQPKKKPEAK